MFVMVPSFGAAVGAAFGAGEHALLCTVQEQMICRRVGPAGCGASSNAVDGRKYFDGW